MPRLVRLRPSLRSVLVPHAGEMVPAALLFRQLNRCAWPKFMQLSVLYHVHPRPKSQRAAPPPPWSSPRPRGRDDFDELVARDLSAASSSHRLNTSDTLPSLGTALRSLASAFSCSAASSSSAPIARTRRRPACASPPPSRHPPRKVAHRSTDKRRRQWRTCVEAERTSRRSF